MPRKHLLEPCMASVQTVLDSMVLDSMLFLPLSLSIMVYIMIHQSYVRPSYLRHNLLSAKHVILSHIISQITIKKCKRPFKSRPSLFKYNSNAWNAFRTSRAHNFILHVISAELLLSIQNPHTPTHHLDLIESQPLSLSTILHPHTCIQKARFILPTVVQIQRKFKRGCESKAPNRSHKRQTSTNYIVHVVQKSNLSRIRPA